MTNLKKIVTNLILIACVISFFSACKKDGGVIEERLVVTKINRSINTDYNVVEFNCVNENLCFAFCQKGNLFKLFKTNDGGKNWNEINLGFDYSWDLTIQSIVFLDENNGIVVFSNRAYRTYDGGETWTDYIKLLPPPGANYAFEFIFAGKNENNEFLLVESTGNSWINNRMFTSAVSSYSYNQILSFSHHGEHYDYGHLSNGKFFYLTRDFNHWDEKVCMYDFATQSMDTFEFYGSIVRDAMYSNGRALFAREYGQLNFNDGSVLNQDYYNFHDDNYNSIDLIDGYYVAVANKSISTNYDGMWQEVINPDGSGQTDNFLKVQRIDSQNFYVSGNNGLFFKATFE